MRFLWLPLYFLACVIGFPLQSQEQTTNVPGHYLFAWAGDVEKKGNDFLAVIDADPSSASYGRVVTSVVTDQQTMLVHHTEYVMPASGMLFANDHYAGRTFIFDVRDPLHLKIAASFTDMAGFMHPHSFLRLPNGHVLATFQHVHRDAAASSGEGGSQGVTGGLVEIDDQGKVIRSSGNADPAFPDAMLSPYSLVILPEIDRVVSTNSAMHEDDLFRGLTYQVWRLSDLKLLKTAYFDEGANHFGQISPEEPRLAPDGSILVQTLACGIERIVNVDSNVDSNAGSEAPKSQLVYTFPGSFCGVPTIVGHYLLQSVPVTHSVVVLDIAKAATPIEVSHAKLGDTFEPHWTGWDVKTHRVVVTGSEPRLYLLKFDPDTGALSMDEGFHDSDGKAGVNFADRDWPHGWKGSARPHGVVFSR